MALIDESIPHRPPFLLVDDVVEVGDDAIVCRTKLDPDHPLWQQVYAGHYPGNPITPGVLLCEMVFQAAAVLMYRKGKSEGLSGTPVLTKIDGARFREIIYPGDEVEVRATFLERISNAFTMQGEVRKGGKAAVRVSFVVALVNAG